VQVQIASDDDNTLASGSDAIANNSKIDGAREEKRKRTPDDDDAAAAACDRDDDVKPLKFIKVEEVGKMGVSQLRAALSDRGIVATTGAKKAALVDQLTAVLDKDLTKQQQHDGAEIETGASLISVYCQFLLWNPLMVFSSASVGCQCMLHTMRSSMSITELR
jgi:hypothetical protein